MSTGVKDIKYVTLLPIDNLNRRVFQTNELYEITAQFLSESAGLKCPLVYREVPKLSTPPFSGVYLTLRHFTATAVRSNTPSAIQI